MMLMIINKYLFSYCNSFFSHLLWCSPIISQGGETNGDNYFHDWNI